MVENALRTAGRGPPLGREATGRVELHVERPRARVPAGVPRRAFERFSRADAGSGGGGTGLGLAIVEAIARAHGGSAGARNATGGGADVWIRLPR